MKRYLSLFLLSMLFFGFGCQRTTPLRPAVPAVPQPAPVMPETEVTSSSSVIGYLRLDGGSALLVRDAATSTAQNDLELLDGDQLMVVTGPVTIVYPNAGESRLETGTYVLLESSEDTGEIHQNVQLFDGSMWTRFEKVFGKDESFSVNANGVVATVRGTAFGVGFVDGEVDVQVAEHVVDVTDERDVKKARALQLTAGAGLKVRPADLTKQDVKKMVRKLTDAEKKNAGFHFGQQKLRLENLRAPVKPVRLRRQRSSMIENSLTDVERAARIARRQALIQQLRQQATRRRELRLQAPTGTQFQLPTRLPTTKDAAPLLPR